MPSKKPQAPQHLLLVGRPGTGRTMLARRMGDQLTGTTFSLARVRDTEVIHAVAGLPASFAGLPAPFRAPHYTVSDVGMCGALVRGWHFRPGELSLAHGGTLFLDEVAEFRRGPLVSVVEALRTGTVPVGNLRVPAEFRLIAATHPCPCGQRATDTSADHCVCTEAQVSAYMARVAVLQQFCRVVYEAEYMAMLAEMLRAANGV